MAVRFSAPDHCVFMCIYACILVHEFLCFCVISCVYIYVCVLASLCYMCVHVCFKCLAVSVCSGHKMKAYTIKCLVAKWYAKRGPDSRISAQEALTHKWRQIGRKSGMWVVAERGRQGLRSSSRRFYRYLLHTFN